MVRRSGPTMAKVFTSNPAAGATPPPVAAHPCAPGADWREALPMLSSAAVTLARAARATTRLALLTALSPDDLDRTPSPTRRRHRRSASNRSSRHAGQARAGRGSLLGRRAPRHRRASRPHPRARARPRVHDGRGHGGHRRRVPRHARIPGRGPARARLPVPHDAACIAPSSGSTCATRAPTAPCASSAPRRKACCAGALQRDGMFLDQVLWAIVAGDWCGPRDVSHPSIH